METQLRQLPPPVRGRPPQAPFGRAVAHDPMARQILQEGLPVPHRVPPSGAIHLKGPSVRQPMQRDSVALRDDLPQQVRVPSCLIPQTEPGGGSPQVRAEFKGALRGQGQPALEAIQSLGWS